MAETLRHTRALVALRDLTRNLCRDPETVQAEAERERQRALAEAVVRNLNTHELVAIASGRVSAGLGANGEQRAGVSEETRQSFIKISAGKGGYVPSKVVTDSPGPTLRAGNFAAGSSPDLESGHAARDAAGPKSACVVLTERSCPESHFPGSAAPGEALPSRQNFEEGAAPGGVSEEALTSKGRGRATGATDSVKETAPGAYSDNSCSVCLEEYEEGKQLLQLTCGHVFHHSCIDLWLMSHRVCPCCRADLDKLAKVAQIFPTKSRRSLQRALANAEGNIMVAVDVLLSERDRRGVEANDGARAAARSGLMITSEAARPLQASDRPPGTSRSTGEELICGLVSLSRERDGAAFGGSTSGGPANDSARDPGAVGFRSESRPSSAAAASLFGLSFGRTRARDAEAVSGATSSQAPQLPAVTATGGSVGGGNRSAEGLRSTTVMVDEEMGASFSQQVSMAIARALQQRSSPEPSRDATELHQRLGGMTASPRSPGRLEANP